MLSVIVLLRAAHYMMVSTLHVSQSQCHIGHSYWLLVKPHLLFSVLVCVFDEAIGCQGQALGQWVVIGFLNIRIT